MQRASRLHVNKRPNLGKNKKTESVLNVLNVKKRSARGGRKKSAEEDLSKNVSNELGAKRKNAKEEKRQNVLKGFDSRRKSVRE